MTSVTARGIVGQLLATRHAPLFRSSAALTVNTAVNAALGFLYWIAAARLYPDQAVGYGAAAISALQLAAGIGWTGLQYTLMRYLPRAGERSAWLVLAAYGGASAVAVPVAAAIVVYGDVTGHLAFASEDPIQAAVFIVGVAAWVLFSLEDAALIGLSRAAWVPLENGAYGLLKLAILAGFAASASAWGLLVSWALGAVCLVIIVNVVLFARVLPSRGKRGELPAVRELVRFTAGHHVAALVAALPDWIVPLLVIALVSREANAHYYAAWTVAFSLRLVFVNIANALVVEGGRDRDSLVRLLRIAALLGLVGLVPIVVVTLLAAHPILSVFGRSYAAGASVLQLFAIGLVPFAAATLFVAVERVEERVAPSLAVLGVSAVVTVAADLLLLPRMGIDGAGWGWILGQTAALIIAGGPFVGRLLASRSPGPALDPNVPDDAGASSSHALSEGQAAPGATARPGGYS